MDGTGFGGGAGGIRRPLPLLNSTPVIAAGAFQKSPVVRGAGAPDVKASFFSVIHAFLNDNGEFLVEANLSGAPAGANTGLWSDGGGGGVDAVVLEGDSAGPGFPGLNFNGFNTIALTDFGTVGR